MVPQQGVEDPVWGCLRAPCASMWILVTSDSLHQELPLGGTGLHWGHLYGWKSGCGTEKWQRNARSGCCVGGEDREAAVPSRGSAGAIRGLERPLLAPGSRRNNPVGSSLIVNFLRR